MFLVTHNKNKQVHRRYRTHKAYEKNICLYLAFICGQRTTKSIIILNKQRHKMVQALDRDSLVAKHESLKRVIINGYNEIRSINHLFQDFCKLLPEPEKPISLEEYKKVVDGHELAITENSLFFNWFVEMVQASSVVLPTDFDLDVSDVQNANFPLVMNITGHDSNHTFYFKNSEDAKAYHQVEEEFWDYCFGEIEIAIAMYKDCFGDMITHDDF